MMIAKRNDPGVTIRFPAPLLRQVTEAAKANGRSMNSEVINRLDQSFLKGKKKS